MAMYKIIGTEGELEVVEKVPCPNCEHKLMPLPPSYPMYDVQCTACNFRAQIKTCSESPQKAQVIRGAGWDIMEKVLKAGYLIPPLIVNFKWKEGEAQKQEIRFYPFVRKKNLLKRVANIHQGKRIYNMFDYYVVGLQFQVLYQQS